MLEGPNGALQILGITLIGATPENGRRLLLTAAFIVAVLLIGRAAHWILARIAERLHNRRAGFWTRQVVNITLAAFLLLGVLSIWFDDPTRLATALGLVTAGLAFALQRVITATAGYFIILRGNTFNIGDRIVMGGVRGDVIALSFMQTTILEMGDPSATAGRDPQIRGRQYTGRIVTVTNAKVFDEPVFNYTREFPFIWDEMTVPVRYGDDRALAEAILIEAARKHSGPIMEMGADDAAELQRHYGLPTAKVDPRVYLRLTNSWVELSVRFLARPYGARELKDAISREILQRFDEAGLKIATSTFDVVGTLPVRIEGGADALAQAGSNPAGRPGVLS